MDGRVRYQLQDGKESKPLLVTVTDVEEGLPRTKEEVGTSASGSTSVQGLRNPNGGLSATSSVWRRASVREGVHQLSQGTRHLMSSGEDGVVEFWARFTRKGKKNVGVLNSLKAILFSSCECKPPSIDVQ